MATHGRQSSQGGTVARELEDRVRSRERGSCQWCLHHSICAGIDSTPRRGFRSDGALCEYSAGMFHSLAFAYAAAAHVQSYQAPTKRKDRKRGQSTALGSLFRQSDAEIGRQAVTGQQPHSGGACSLVAGRTKGFAQGRTVRCTDTAGLTGRSANIVLVCSARVHVRRRRSHSILTGANETHAYEVLTELEAARTLVPSARAVQVEPARVLPAVSRTSSCSTVHSRKTRDDGTHAGVRSSKYAQVAGVRARPCTSHLRRRTPGRVNCRR